MSNILSEISWARRLKIRHLEVFLTLHETGSLTAAAAQLHMTQPALSHWLADMEDVIGRPLFVRNRRFALTEAGEAFREHAIRMIGDVQRTHAELHAIQSGLQGRLHLGTGLPRVLLPNAIARLQQSRPGIFVSVVEAPQPDLLERLSAREIDIIIGALSVDALRSGFATEVLIADTVQVVARCGHPFLEQKETQWQDTNQYPWILPPVGSVMRDVFDKAFAAQNLRPPTPCVEANSSIRLQLLLGDRNYLSILSASEVQLYCPLGLIERIPLLPEIPFPNIGAIWQTERLCPIMSHFLDALRIESSAMTMI